METNRAGFRALKKCCVVFDLRIDICLSLEHPLCYSSQLMPLRAFDTPSHGRVYDLFTTRRQSGGFSNVSQENPPRCNYSGTGPVGGAKPKGEDSGASGLSRASCTA